MCLRSSVCSCVNAANESGSVTSEFSDSPSFTRLTRLPISHGSEVSLFLYRNSSVRWTRSLIDVGMAVICNRQWWLVENNNNMIRFISCATLMPPPRTYCSDGTG